MSFSASRLTIFALLSAVETDLRSMILHDLGHLDAFTILGESLFARVQLRFATEDGGIPTSIAEISEFLDFGDTFALLNQHSYAVDADTASELKRLTPTLEMLVPIRNRVAHVRPLHYDDLANTLDNCERLLTSRKLHWTSLKGTFERLKKEPSFVLGLKIPDSGRRGDENHNLPLPDFDETGFVGRKKEVADLKQLCLGPYPVISLVGEGGLGKTALALKVAYDLLDEHSDRFDAIVWSTSKSTQLTASEIRKIGDAISTSLGLFDSIASHLAGGVRNTDSTTEILDYLKSFPILLILDNLETVLDDRIRDFLSSLPRESKILITSRVGLGAFEAPYRLTPLQATEAVQLLRATAKVHGLTNLFTLPGEVLKNYCEKMHRSPGQIKWFVSAVASGRRPEEVLAKPELFLEFCMSNIYNNLHPESKAVLASMISIPGTHSQAELAFLNSLDVQMLQKSLQQLLSTNIVLMTTEREGPATITKYSIADMPRSYMLRHHKPHPEEDALFRKRNGSLLAAVEKMGADLNAEPLNYTTLKVRSKSDLIVARFLKQALTHISNKQFDLAETEIDLAGKLAPDYFEVARVTALLRIQEDNYPAAREAFEAAIELEPNSAPLRFWYGKFLLREAGDAVNARLQLQEANKLLPDDIEIEIELAHSHLFLHDFKAAREIMVNMSVERAGSSDKKIQRFYDLALSYRQRLADSHSHEGDEEASLQELRALRQVYEATPLAFRDSRLKAKLGKAIISARFCESRHPTPQGRDDAHELRTWMVQESSGGIDSAVLRQVNAGEGDEILTEGRIRNIVFERGFGFITTGSDRLIFFHNTVTSPPSLWHKLKDGDLVRFKEGTNAKGASATVVRKA